jgi:dTDP-glucose 4,6-dehydratase
MHLAAESHVDRSITGPGDFIHLTSPAPSICSKPAAISGTANRDGVRFITSPPTKFMARSADGIFTEHHALRANSPYSASKASPATCSSARIITPTALPTVITNCSNNYGPFQFPEKLIPVVIQSAPRAQAHSGLRRRHERARLALRPRPCRRRCGPCSTRGKIAETYNIGGHNEWANIHIVELICDTIDEFAPQLGGNSRKLITL